MSDDVDDLNAALRRAMASLDRQVPAGYFEALPDRTLARLDDPAIGPGLHAAIGPDIRPDLGPDTREPPVSDIERARGAAAAAASPRARRWQRAVITAGIGVAAAAGAVLFLTVRARDGSHARESSTRELSVVAATSSPSNAQAEGRDQEKLRVEQRAATLEVSAGAASDDAAERRPRARPGSEVPGSARDMDRLVERERQRISALEAATGQAGSSEGDAAKAGPSAATIASKSSTPAPASPAVEPTVEGDLVSGPRGQGGGASSQGVAPAPSKTHGARRALSKDDFERGMTAMVGQVRACVAGTKGVAALRLLVMPNGRVAKVTVSGPFAGTPMGSCIERTAGRATFLPWDGRPQRFDYSYSLSD
jgi:hypothetical protein